ncbi:MAG: hypothetical protein IT572_00285, partial [Deltaproteobacteria bacterium]|nr:hypothetical protein [Deltaproteobacteria bacterium]
MGDTLASILSASRGPLAADPAVPGAFSAQAVVSALLEGPEGIGARLTEGQRAQLSALAGESDEGLFWRGLLSFGGALESAEKFDAAGRVYAAVVGAVREGPLRSTAENRLNAILGKGAFSPRFEFLLKRFTKDASDPKMIVPMLAGTAVYGLARTAALGRLATGARGAWYTQGFGARLAASSLGFAAEVPTFALSSRALRQIGADGSLPQPGLGHEFASAAFTLGFLKTFAFAGQQSYARLHGLHEAGTAMRFSGLTKFSQPLLSQGAMFAGLMTAHKAEEGFGLRSRVDGATTVTDTLASMFSLGVGARLGHYALGPRFASFQREMEFRTGLALLQGSMPQATAPRAKLTAGRDLRAAHGRLAASAAGLAAFLPERLAFAQSAGSGAQASDPNSVAMTWLSTAVVGGLLAWGAYKIRSHYVAPRGRIAELSGFRAQLESTPQEKLTAQVQKAERYLLEAKDYRRANEEEIAVEAYNFLRLAIPKLEPSQRLASLEKIWDQLTEIGDHHKHLVLRILRETAGSLDKDGVERIAFRAKQGLRYEDLDRALNAVVLLTWLMPLRAPEKRVEAAVAIHQALAGRAPQLTEHLDWLGKGRILLKGMKEFMDQRAAEEKQELRQKIRELNKAREGGESALDFSLDARIRRLEEALKNFNEGEEIDVANAYFKHLREKEEEIPMLWDHRLALDSAEKFQEICHEREAPPGPATVPPTLRARLEGVQPYLKDGGTWLRRLHPRTL